MSLKDRLCARIAQAGPISVADYMAECLLHPTYGYYATRDPLGAQGDFVTAPEISQIFGELIGLCLAQSWLDQGAPERFCLAELGPGRGSLMADALRSAARVPGFLAAAELVLVEASAPLRARQAQVLGAHNPQWVDRVEDLPDAPLFLVANEFFDALPIRQFQRAGAGWSERRIGCAQGALCFGLGPAGPVEALAHRLNDTKDGDVVEICPQAHAIIASVSDRIARFGGAGLIVDYGDWQAQGDTLQAVQAHEPTDPLAAPGAADLTAHVDFAALAAAARCAYSRLTPQGVFLERLGITQRAQVLANGAAPEARADLVAAHRRLTHPAEMGNLFKVLGLYPSTASPPPGLNP